MYAALITPIECTDQAELTAATDLLQRVYEKQYRDGTLMQLQVFSSIGIPKVMVEDTPGFVMVYLMDATREGIEEIRALMYVVLERAFPDSQVSVVEVLSGHGLSKALPHLKM